MCHGKEFFRVVVSLCADQKCVRVCNCWSEKSDLLVHPTHPLPPPQPQPHSTRLTTTPKHHHHLRQLDTQWCNRVVQCLLVIGVSQALKIHEDATPDPEADASNIPGIRPRTTARPNQIARPGAQKRGWRQNQASCSLKCRFFWPLKRRLRPAEPLSMALRTSRSPSFSTAKGCSIGSGSDLPGKRANA